LAYPTLTALPTPITFDGGMLLVATAERLLAYNASAHHIWSELAEGRTPSEIAATLAATFGMDPAAVSADVDAIVAHWKEEGVLDGRFQVPSPPVEPDPPDAAGEAVWAVRWVCRLGARLVEFAVEDATSAARLRGALRPLEVDRGTPEARIEVRASGDGTSIVLRDGRVRRRFIRLDGLKEAVYESVLGVLWPERAIDTLIHAGAVARHGIGLCLAAASGSGKSTLVAQLCGLGYQYLTDDLAAIDRTGEVLPLPLPMSLKEGSWPFLDHLRPQLESSPAFRVRETWARLITPPGAWDARPTPVGALVFPRYAPGSRAVVQRIRPSDALVKLREAGVWLGHPLTEEHVTRIARWLERTPAYTLEYGDPTAAPQHIDDIVTGLRRSRA
jgi:hypothetical protein